MAITAVISKYKVEKIKTSIIILFSDILRVFFFHISL